MCPQAVRRWTEPMVNTQMQGDVLDHKVGIGGAANILRRQVRTAHLGDNDRTRDSCHGKENTKHNNERALNWAAVGEFRKFRSVFSACFLAHHIRS